MHLTSNFYRCWFCSFVVVPLLFTILSLCFPACHWCTSFSFFNKVGRSVSSVLFAQQWWNQGTGFLVIHCISDCPIQKFCHEFAHLPVKSKIIFKLFFVTNVLNLPLISLSVQCFHQCDWHLLLQFRTFMTFIKAVIYLQKVLPLAFSLYGHIVNKFCAIDILKKPKKEDNLSVNWLIIEG